LSAARSCEVAALLLLPLVLLIAGPPAGQAADDPIVPLLAPTIQSTAPADGELNVSLSGFIEIRFSEAMNQTTLLYAFVPSIAVTESWPQPDTLRLTPTASFPSCTPYDIQVSATDLNESLTLVPGPVPNPWSFMTACPSPFIVATLPRDNDVNVAAATDIVITFSERIRTTSPLGTFTLNPSPPPPIRDDWTENFTRLTRTATLTAGITYTASISGFEDVDGNLLVAGIVPNPWTFTINAPPTVSAPSLSRWGCLDAGSSLFISWTMSDDLLAPEDLTVTLSYRNGSGPQTIVGPARNFPAVASYLWTLPPENVQTNVSIEVRDSADGVAWNWSASATPIRIDTGAPSVLSTFPADGATDVPYRDGTIRITFSEAMNQSTVLVVVEPSLTGAPRVWQSPSVLQIGAGLADRQRYSVTISGMARDTCGAGNPMAADVRFSFTTALAPPSPPRGLTWTDRQETSLTISWDAVVEYATGRPIPPGTVVTYQVERDGLFAGTTDSTQFTDRGLRPATPYTYRVRAFADAVVSAESASLQVETLESFFTTSLGRVLLLILAGVAAGGIAVWAQFRVRRDREVSRSRLQAEVREVVDLIRKTRTEADAGRRRSLEGQLQGRFLALVAAPNERGDTLDPRLDLLYRALAEALVHSPEVDVAHGRSLADARLGTLRPSLAVQGAAYRLLSEAEASVSSELFRGLPESGRKALFLVYFYALEEYLSNRLRVLVPPGATVLLGDRGHINVRRRGWEQQWAGLSLGNLLYLLDHNRQMFLSDEERWEEDVEPFVHQTVDARNRTAHPSREAPPLDRVRELIYTSLRLLESVLKAPKGVAA
jgi:hypothetical protein